MSKLPVIGASVLAGALAGQQTVLDRPLATTDHVIYAPAGELSGPSDASEMGLLSRIARVAGVPFGFESDPASPRSSGNAPVEPHYVKAATLREALDRFVQLDSRYQWRDMQGVFVVRTASAWNDSSNALNQPVLPVQWHSLTVFSAFDRIARLLYPQSPELFAGFNVRNDRPIDVTPNGGTILDVLNAVARSDGEIGWWINYGGPSDQTKFTLTIGHYGNGPTHGWAARPQPTRR